MGGTGPGLNREEYREGQDKEGWRNREEKTCEDLAGHDMVEKLLVVYCHRGLRDLTSDGSSQHHWYSLYLLCERGRCRMDLQAGFLNMEEVSLHKIFLCLQRSCVF